MFFLSVTAVMKTVMERVNNIKNNKLYIIEKHARSAGTSSGKKQQNKVQARRGRVEHQGASDRSTS